MSDPQSDADRIRQRRLARLGGTPSNTSTTTGSNDNTSSINSNATSTGSVGGVGGGSDSRPASALDRLNANASQPRTIAQGGPSSSSSASTSKPSTPVQARPGSSLNVPPTSLNSAASSSLSPSYYNTSTLKPSSSSSTPISTPTAKLNLSANGKPGTTPGGARKLPYEEYESNSILHILNVSPEMVISEFPDNKYGRVGKDESDTLLIAKLSVETKEGEDGGVTIFEYLTGCWKRVHRVNREGLRMGYSEDELIRWKETMDKLKDLIISYCGYTLEDPGMFPQPPGRPVGPAEFLPLLLASNSQASDPYSTSTSNPSSTLAPLSPTLPLTPADLPMFLSDLSNRFKEEGLDGILESVCSEFFQGFFKRQVDGKPVDLLSQEWRAWVGGVAVLTSVKGIAAKLPSLKVWFEESAQPEQIEWFSLLGPITRLSVFPREFPTIYKTYFLNAESRSKDDIKANQLTLGQTLVNLQDDLFQSYNAIVRASPESREKLLSFFAEVVKRNVKRSGMRVDHRTVASDGYMMNMQGMLLRLFEPVMDVTYSKIDRIDSDYYRHSKRVDIKEETKMRAAQDEANEYYSEDKMQTEPTPGSSPFISDIFFLLQTYQHLGLNKTLDNRDRAEKNVKEFKKDLKRLEAEKAGWQAGTPQAMQGEAMLTKLKNDIDVLKASVCAYDAALLNKEIIQKNIAFLSFSMTWLVRLVDPRHAHPAQTIELPLPDEAPLRFRMLPEYLLENISDYLEFVVKHAPPETLDKSDKDVIITFMIVFLSPNYVNNPFLKAKFMSMLAIGVQPWGYFRKGIFYDNLVEHPLAVQHLMPTLIRFFVDVEMTGGHTQFWDKFNFRRDIDSIIQALWSNPEHRNAFVKTRHTDFELVIKFSNMLMSDTTFHLDESLTGLAKINSIRSEMEDRTTWEAKPEAERKELESQLSSAEANTPFHTMMGRSHVKLMKEFTATTKEPFLTGEIVGRLAATLDENMVVMVGPKMQELKVTDPEKFAFKPKELLAEITQIYINLGDSPEFIRAVADDGRSYSKATFERLVRVLKNRAIMLDNEIKQVLAFLGKVEEAKATIEIEDEREIPDEFLDPLMATLMKNPVILPVSRVTVDQSTIRAVLLSNNKDPFNNVPLKYEDCVPDEDLKKRIDAWIAEGSVRPSNLDEPVSMDVDEVANRPE